MYLYSDTLSTLDLDRIGNAMGVRVEHGEFFGARRRRVSFVLRPITDDYRMSRHGRRVNAVSWSGHYVFMRAVFALDANAEIRSAISRYVGALDFAASAYATGDRNVGSHVEPVEYRDAEAAGHVRWSNEADLARLGDEIVATRFPTRV